MIVNIQYLRFIAAFSVIIAHAALQMYGIDAKITNAFGVGVDIFFVISGFIMPFIIYGGYYHDDLEPKYTPLAFMKKRVVRIWPLFFIATTSVLTLSFIVSSGIISNPTVDFAYLFNSSNLDASWYFKSLLFASFDKHLMMTISWTLQYEFIFYSLLALLIAFKLKKLESIETFVVIFLVAGSTIISSGYMDNAISKTIFNPIMVEFILGMYLYRIVSAGIKLNVFTSVIILILFIPAFILLNSPYMPFGSDFFRLILWGGPSFLLVWAALSLEGYIPKNKIFLLFGDASYSLYLSHGITAPLFILCWQKLELQHSVNMYIYIFIYCIFCQCCGVLCYKYVESPITEKLKKW